MQKQSTPGFSGYQIFIIALLATLQFTVVLDFMVLSPLGAILLKELSITTKQFGIVVSAYAFSAGAAGLLAAGFADKFDRKKLLLFFYTGFLIGTLLCGIAPDYNFLLMARIFTGIFGGVIGSISYAIITDLFALEFRGRVMGFVQLAFALSQVIGIPLGLYLATLYNWHAPFLMIVGLGIIIGIIIFLFLKPITAHIQLQTKQNAFSHLATIFSTPQYPFGSAFGVHNLGISLTELPFLYMITGVCMLIFSPMIGYFSDKIGKFKMFMIGSVITAIMTLIYCNLGVTPLWIILILNVLLFVGITGRMISASALMTAVPDMRDRGAFMGVNSSVQQIAGGVAALIAGFIVTETHTGYIENYPLLGYVVVAAVIITIFLMYHIHRYVESKTQNGKPADQAI
jgi:predicted MFS family arabinose efflux permease